MQAAQQWCAKLGALQCEGGWDGCWASKHFASKVGSCSSAFVSLIQCFNQNATDCDAMPAACETAAQVLETCAANVPALNDCDYPECVLQGPDGAYNGCTCTTPCQGKVWGLKCDAETCTCSVDGKTTKTFPSTLTCNNHHQRVMVEYCGMP